MVTWDTCSKSIKYTLLKFILKMSTEASFKIILGMFIIKVRWIIINYESSSILCMIIMKVR